MNLPFFKKSQSYLGVDLGAGGVKMVELKKEKNRPLLYTYGLTSSAQNVHQLLTRKEKGLEQLHAAEEPVKNKKQALLAPEEFSIDEEQVEKYAALIKSVYRQIRATAKVAMASLPVSAVFHAIVTMPIVKKEELPAILNAEIKKLLPYPIEEMAVNSQALPAEPDARSQRVLVNAVPRALVVFFTQVFQRSGLTLDSLEPESDALARALIGRDTATTMLLDMGAERTNFFIIDQAAPMTHHSIELGGERINRTLERAWGAAAADAERMKRDLFSYLSAERDPVVLSKEQFLSYLTAVIEPIAKEIEYSLDLFLRQSGNAGKRPEKVVLTGGAAHFPYLAEYIAEKFKIKCYVGDPWGRVVYQESLRPILSDIGPRMSVAIGLALRHMV